MVHSVNPVAEADRLWEVASRPFSRATAFAKAIYTYSRHCLLYGVTSDEGLVHRGSLVLTEAIDRMRRAGVAHPHILLPYALDHDGGRPHVVPDCRIAALAAAPSAVCPRYSAIPGAYDKPRSARMLASVINAGFPPLEVAGSFWGYDPEGTEAERLPGQALDIIVCQDGVLYLGDDGWWVG